jgi:hypothetical protein
VGDVAHTAVCVAWGAPHFELVAAKRNFVTIRNLDVGDGATRLRYNGIGLGDELLEETGPGDVVSVDVSIN